MDSETAYEYSSRKTAIVLSTAITDVIAVGVVGHICQSIGYRMTANDMGRSALFDTAGNKYVGISRYPVVVLAAKPTQLNKLFLSLQTENELVIGNFASAMLTTRHDDELMAELARIEPEQIDMFGIGLFGKSERIHLYTRKFSVWKGGRTGTSNGAI